MWVISVVAADVNQSLASTGFGDVFEFGDVNYEPLLKPRRIDICRVSR